MVLALHCYCGQYIKYRLFSKHLFRRMLQYGGWKNMKVTTNVYEKQLLPVIKGNKKRLSKQVVEKFYAAATFEILWVFSFATV